jgi:hypothetical protein
MKATNWQAHSVRGFVSRMLTNKMGLNVESTENDDGERYYRIAGKYIHVRIDAAGPLGWPRSSLWGLPRGTAGLMQIPALVPGEELFIVKNGEFCWRMHHRSAQ